MNLIDLVTDETNLLKAWIKVRYYANTSTPYFDRLAYDVFEDSQSEHLRVLQFELKQGSFRFSPLRYFEIPKQNGTRKMYFGDPKDEIVAQAIVNVIGPIFEATFLDVSFGNRLNTDRAESKAIFKSWLHQYEHYVRKVRAILRHPNHYWYQVSDFSNFYPSINKNTLRSEIAHRVDDSRVLELVDQLLAIDAISLQGALEPLPGLPPGPAYSHFFANVHLGGFDRLMVANTVEYYRYVDDFCFLVSEQSDVEKVNALIKEFFAARSETEVVLNAEKTESRSLNEPEVLTGHTAKLKYDLRFDALSSIISIADSSDDMVRQSNAERLFRDLFTKVEGDEDPTEVVRKSAGFIASRLDELVLSRDEALNIAYGLLRLKPNRISALRVVINAIIELSLGSDVRMARLVEYLVSSEVLYQAVFLQLINGYRPVPRELLDLVRREMVHNPNGFLRAAAYYATSHAEYAIDTTQFRDWVQNEKSAFAMKYLVNCIRNLSIEGSDHIWIELGPLRQSQDPVVLAVLGFALRNALDKQIVSAKLLEILYTPPFAWAFQNIDVAIPSLKLLFAYGHSMLIKAAHNAFVEGPTHEFTEIANVLVHTVALDTIHFLMTVDKTEQLFQFVDSLNQLGLSAAAITGYQEIASKSDDTALALEARRRRVSIDETWILPGLPQWYKLDTCDRGIYCQLPDEPEYQCREYKCQATGDRGTLEIVSQTRVGSNSVFGVTNEWLDYLKELDDKGLICLRDAGLLQGNSVFAIYEVPDGFLSLSEVIAGSQFAKTEAVAMALIESTIEAMEQTRTGAGFHFYNVSPCNVLWNPLTKQIMFLNIGSSLAVPKYSCGVKTCNTGAHQTEIGIGTDCYFVGLLAIQILAQACPVQFLEDGDKRTRKKNGKNSRANPLGRLGLLPHTRSIIGRATLAKPDYRYGELLLLLGDIQEVVEFLEHVATPSENLVLVDYLTFRLRVIGRNPQVVDAPLSRKLREAVRQLSNDLSYYDIEALSVWADEMSWRRYRNDLPGWLTWRWQGTESRNLLLLARGWQTLVDEASKEARKPYSNGVGYLIAIWSLYSELLSVIAGVLSTYRGDANAAAKCEDIANAVLNSGASLDTAQIRYTVDSRTMIVPNQFLDAHIQDATRMVASGLKTVYSGLFWDGESIAAMAALLCLFCLECEIVDQTGQTIVTGKGPLKIDSAPRNLAQLWMMVRRLFEVERLLESTLIVGSTAEDISNQQEWGGVINQLMEYLRKLNPAKRIPATLTQFSPLSSPRDGIVSLGLPPRLARYFPVRHTISALASQIHFTEAESLIVGDLIPRIKGRVDVDLVSNRVDKAPASVLGEVNLFRDLVKLRPSRRNRTRRFVRKHRRQIIAALISVLLVPILIVVVQNVLPQWLENPAPTTKLSIGLILWAILTSILGIFQSVLGNVLTPNTASRPPDD